MKLNAMVSVAVSIALLTAFSFVSHAVSPILETNVYANAILQVS